MPSSNWRHGKNAAPPPLFPSATISISSLLKPISNQSVLLQIVSISSITHQFWPFFLKSRWLILIHFGCPQRRKNSNYTAIRAIRLIGPRSTWIKCANGKVSPSSKKSSNVQRSSGHYREKSERHRFDVVRFDRHIHHGGSNLSDESPLGGFKWIVNFIFFVFFFKSHFSFTGGFWFVDYCRC